MDKIQNLRTEISARLSSDRTQQASVAGLSQVQALMNYQPNPATGKAMASFAAGIPYVFPEPYLANVSVASTAQNNVAVRMNATLPVPKMLLPECRIELVGGKTVYQPNERVDLILHVSDVDLSATTGLNQVNPKALKQMNTFEPNSFISQLNTVLASMNEPMDYKITGTVNDGYGGTSQCITRMTRGVNQCPFFGNQFQTYTQTANWHINY